MRILVLSDTHVSDPKAAIPEKIIAQINKCDCCLHAGDIETYSFYKKISQKIKTYAVAGNMDDELISLNLPQRQTIKIAGFNFGLIHGRGTPAALLPHIDYHFQADYDKIDLFVFGHSHSPVDIKRNGKIYFNPGSAGDWRFGLEPTCGIISIENNQIKRSIEKIG